MTTTDIRLSSSLVTHPDPRKSSQIHNENTKRNKVCGHHGSVVRQICESFVFCQPNKPSTIHRAINLTNRFTGEPVNSMCIIIAHYSKPHGQTQRQTVRRLGISSCLACPVLLLRTFIPKPMVINRTPTNKLTSPADRLSGLLAYTT